MQVKVCKSCQVEKSTDDFYLRVARRGSLQTYSTYCKPCDAIRQTEYRTGQRLPMTGEQATRSKFLISLKEGATRRGLAVTVTDEALLRLAGHICYFCSAPPRDFSLRVIQSRQAAKIQAAERHRLNGTVPRFTKKPKAPPPKILLNGIDRLDSNKGYETGNIVSCCGACNIAKNDYTEAEFALNTIERFSWAQSYAEAYPDSIQALLAKRKADENT